MQNTHETHFYYITVALGEWQKMKRIGLTHSIENNRDASLVFNTQRVYWLSYYTKSKRENDI